MGSFDVPLHFEKYNFSDEISDDIVKKLDSYPFSGSYIHIGKYEDGSGNVDKKAKKGKKEKESKKKKNVKEKPSKRGKSVKKGKKDLDVIKEEAEDVNLE